MSNGAGNVMARQGKEDFSIGRNCERIDKVESFTTIKESQKRERK
jgi:hypothetical protein